MRIVAQAELAASVFTDPGHWVLFVVALAAVAFAMYLPRRREDVHHDPDGDDHLRGTGHRHTHSPGHGPADPERDHR